MFRLAVLIAFLLVLSTSAWLSAAEGRIPISDPFAVLGAITESGSYIVTNDLDAPNGPGIVIDADHVTIDLDGHTVRVSDGSPAISASGRTDITILNGKLFGDGVGSNGILLGGAGAEFRVENVTVTGFTAAGVNIQGVFGIGAARVVLVGNTVRGGGAGQAGVYLLNIEASRIEQNQLRESLIGMSMVNVFDSIVKDNVLSQNISLGLEVIAASNNTISENTVTRNAGDGIFILLGAPASIDPATGTNNIITHNDVSQNGGEGIHVRNFAGFNTISYNNTSGNGGNGIFLGDLLVLTSAVDNTLDWNVAGGNGDCGIRFGTGAGTSVAGNIFSNNRAPGNLNSSTQCGSAGLPAGYFDTGACGGPCNVDAGGNQ